MYLVALYWSGSMNVDSMRSFNEQSAVIKYLEELEIRTNSYPNDPRPSHNHGDITSGLYRVYQLFPDSPPKNVKDYFHNRLTFIKKAL